MPTGGELASVFTWVDLLGRVSEILLVAGLFVAWRQYRGEHERARREKAIEYILTWAKELDRRGTLARKLVEALDIATARHVFNQEPFQLDERYGPMLEGVFPSIPPAEAGKFHIDAGNSAQLRWLIVSYLNNLEAIMSAWLHNVADRDIIGSQFRFLVSPREGHYILRDFRAAADGPQNYPGIEAFVSHITSERNSVGKRPI